MMLEIEQTKSPESFSTVYFKTDVIFTIKMQESTAVFDRFLDAELFVKAKGQSPSATVEVLDMENIEAFRREFVPACSDDVQPDVVIQDGIATATEPYTPILCESWTRLIRPGQADKLRCLVGMTNAKPWSASINNSRGYYAPGAVIIGEVRDDVVVFYNTNKVNWIGLLAGMTDVDVPALCW